VWEKNGTRKANRAERGPMGDRDPQKGGAEHLIRQDARKKSFKEAERCPTLLGATIYF
jgi:hypothetical protein